MEKEEAKLGDILISKGWIDQGVLQAALKKQIETRDFLGNILLREKRVTEEQLAIALSEQHKIPFVRLSNFYVDWKLAMRFSASLILDRKCFPVRTEKTDVIFAVTNLLNSSVLAQIELEVRGYQVKCVLVTQSDMDDLLERYRQYVNIKMRKQLDQNT